MATAAPKPIRWIKRIAVFADREDAQTFAAACRDLGQEMAHVSSLSSQVMTSDNSPSVWVHDSVRTQIEQVSA